MTVSLRFRKKYPDAASRIKKRTASVGAIAVAAFLALFTRKKAMA